MKLKEGVIDFVLRTGCEATVVYMDIKLDCVCLNRYSTCMCPNFTVLVIIVHRFWGLLEALDIF